MQYVLGLWIRNSLEGRYSGLASVSDFLITDDTALQFLEIYFGNVIIEA